MCGNLTVKLYIDSKNCVEDKGDYMASDIDVYYVKAPDDRFFIMKGRREFAIENEELIPDEVEEYFSEVKTCKEGIRVPISVSYDYVALDCLRVTFNVKDIPFGADKIIVEYG